MALQPVHTVEVRGVPSARAVGALLNDIQPRDPATFAGAAIVLVVVGLLAGLVPALRATRVDPAVVLWSE